MTQPPASARWHEVPPGTRAAECIAGCGATVYWIKTANDRNLPVDCAVDGAHEPSARVDPLQQDVFGMTHTERSGKGICHFDVCPMKDDGR